MLNSHDILQTIGMIQNENLDVRTVTVGVSLFDTHGNPDKIYDKITRTAEKLVPVCEGIEAEFGLPIINKRVSVTPIALLGNENPIEIAKAMDKAAKTIGVDFIGGYSALVQKGITPLDKALIDSIPAALAETDIVCSSVNVASTKAGINLDACKIMGEKIIETASITQKRSCIGAAKLVVFCNAVEDNPFMAGAFHGPGEGDSVINVGVSGPGAVLSALRRHPNSDITKISEIIKKTAFKITRAGMLVGNRASAELGIPFGIIDLSLAPTPAVGDSVARILEEIGIEVCGTHGTTVALALLNDAVKKGGVMASSRVGGLSGAFIPVSEDEGMIAAAESGMLTFDKLEAMTSVCSVGLDMIAVPGDTPASTISAIIADQSAIGMINGKTTAVRLIPAVGHSAGDTLEFGGLLGSAPIMPVHTAKADRLIDRGGLIPAPLQALRN